MVQETNKLALVTGANKGIGFEIARGLCSNGITVLLGCRNPKLAEEAVESLVSQGLSAKSLAIDVTNSDTIASAANQIEQEYGRLDILVNNAGISGQDRQPPSKADLAKVREVYETNVFGVIAVTQAMLPLLLLSKSGRIVNVSSGLGSLGQASDPTSHMSKMQILGYNSSKTALNAITVMFANELRDTPVKVNAICPGYCATALNNFSGPRTPEQGAQIAIKMALLEDDGPTGAYFDDAGRVAW